MTAAAPTPRPASLRLSGPSASSQAGLGPFRELPGVWRGEGFNLISRPDEQEGKEFFLQLSATHEILEFTQIGAPIPNRGTEQGDIFFLGVHYLQQISDAETNGALHLEPGIWINVPATTAPAAPASVARLATIPHGDALVAQGSSFEVNGGPQIAVESSTPLQQGTETPLTDRGYLAPFSATTPPAGIPQAAIADPNLVLRNAIAGQNIVKTTVIEIDTETQIGQSPGGIENIAFVDVNANAVRMSATFWIEVVEHVHGLGQFLQLQYTQKVFLRFLGIDWPHITVETLVKH